MSRTPNDALSRVEPPRVIQNKPPLFKGTDLVKSANLVDMLAGRLMPGILKFDQAAAGNVAHILIPASPKRVSIVLFPPVNGSVTVWTDSTVGVGGGIVLTLPVGPITLSSNIVGDLVTREFYAIGSVANALIAWIEVYGPDNVCLEDQMRQGSNW